MSPEDIDKLTIAEVRAIVERASAALKTLQELGLAPAAPPSFASIVRSMTPATTTPPLVVPGASPYPCAACGRTAVVKPGEPASPIECQLCGNPLPLDANAPGVRQSNKGPLVMDPEMLARRASLIAQPAFGPDGEPIS